MSNNVKKISSAICTGCSACQNICNFEAIQMIPNDEGFIMPAVDMHKCIDCGKCVRQCPALHPTYENNKNPKLYAAMANDDIRAVSSSGGIFSLVANAVLKKGGYVCGAAFDEKMSLAHCLVNTEDEMPKLRGSKYVQSNIGFIYRDIEKLLSEDNYVLFTGTPCQVAGLKAYLSKDYEHLYSIDILCHGVPSQKLFSKYIRGVSITNKAPNGQIPKVSNVNFRDKKFGWSCEYIQVAFENGKVYESGLKQSDPYEVVFFRNLGLRKSCADCSFSVFPRQGDISVGDFWGISRFDKEMTDGKGTSMLYINNNRGEELFSLIRDELIKLKEMTIAPEEIRNRVHAKAPINKNRDRFLKLAHNHTIIDSIKKATENQYDVGLVSNFYAANLGGAMTQYALYHTLEDAGYSTLMIERPDNARDPKRFHGFDRIFIESLYPDYALSPSYKDKVAMRALNQKCGTFVVGSDQLFQYDLYRLLGKFVTLDWVSDDKKKIAYAASYGHDKIWGDQKVHSEMAYFMQKFDAFSVREKSGVRISKEHYGVDADWVIDPVFLCDTKHYQTLADKVERECMPHFIGGYILDPTVEKQHIFKHAMDKLSLPCEIFSEYNCSAKYIAPLGDLNVPQLKTEERIKNILNCDFFITDSFHGTCFSIIMKKPFIAIMNKKRGAERFKSLLSMLHLEDRLIENEKDLSRPNLFEPINYDAVYEILDKEKIRCKEWLLNALKAPKLKSYSDYDVLQSLIAEQNIKIENLTRMLTGLLKADSRGLSEKTDMLGYLELLNAQKEDRLILISVKDTPGLKLDSLIAGKLIELGVHTNMQGKHAHSYIAIINRGNLLYERLGSGMEPSVYEGDIEGHRMYVTSRVYKNGNESIIRVNGLDHAVNRRGLNIVVLDAVTGAVADSVCFDTHVPTFDCSRR